MKNNDFFLKRIFKKIFHRKKTLDEMKMDVLEKAKKHIGVNDALLKNPKKVIKKRKLSNKTIDPNVQYNIKLILVMLAHSGETGVLSKTVADELNIKPIETRNALIYLVGKKYAEVVNGTLGEKYYLSELGRRYCVNKKYI